MLHAAQIESNRLRKNAEIRAKTSPKKWNRTPFLFICPFAECGSACGRFFCRYIFLSKRERLSIILYVVCGIVGNSLINAKYGELAWILRLWIRWTSARHLFRWRRIMYTNYDWVERSEVARRRAISFFCCLLRAPFAVGTDGYSQRRSSLSIYIQYFDYVNNWIGAWIQWQKLHHAWTVKVNEIIRARAIRFDRFALMLFVHS